MTPENLLGKDLFEWHAVELSDEGRKFARVRSTTGMARQMECCGTRGKELCRVQCDGQADTRTWHRGLWKLKVVHP